jgi:hypothetical protein
LQVFRVRLYQIGVGPLGATKFASKLTSRSRETIAERLPMPCAVWHVEHEKPALMCSEGPLKLVLAGAFRSWPLPL